MQYKIWKKYMCDHCWKDTVYDPSISHSAKIVYCQSGDNFYQEIACSWECYDILEDNWLNPKVYTCAKCKKKISESETYEYRWFHSCSDCFEKLQEDVEYKRKEVMEVIEHSTKSQAWGEWHNGWYKTMKTDIWWNPITKIKEPQILKDYENWIL